MTSSPELAAAVVEESFTVGRWRVERRRGSVASLHALDAADVLHGPGDGPVITLMAPTDSAVVLGSIQDDSVVDAHRAAQMGLEVVRRRSGGGAVLVTPTDPVWVDVWLPRGDALWLDDVGAATHWLGRVWVEVADSLGIAARVHTGAMRTDEVARLVCFAGVGPGEVLVGDAKLVGISQRRTRQAARFQCSWITRWDPAPLIAALGITDATIVARLATCGAGAGTDPAVVTDRLLAVLARH